MNPGVLVIAGPTASGKKRLALRAAEMFDGEIVSADSRKVYRHLNIGTAKPSAADRARVRHHLIDIVEPDGGFSAGEWVRRASEAVETILGRGKVPVLSGGTGFYIEAFMNGLTVGLDAEPAIRERLRRELAANGPESMHRRLTEVDPRRASELPVRDTVRVMRALEVFEATGRPFSGLADNPRISGGAYRYLVILTGMERERLYWLVDRRVDSMVEAGLVGEVRSLLDRGFGRGLVALDTVGYKEWFPLIDGKASFEDCMDAVKRDTRRYAKRQLTWFRNRPWSAVPVDTLDEGSVDSALDTAARWLRGGGDVAGDARHPSN